MLIALPLVVTACAGSSPSADKIDLDPPDAALTAPPPPLTADPGRAITQAETEIFWSRDRAAYGMCFQKHQGLVLWSDAIIAAFTTGKRSPP